MNSRIQGFYKMSTEERRKALASLGVELPPQSFGSLPQNVAERMVENVITIMELPFGIATNFRVNGTDRLVPMAVEETSVVAAASHAAKLAREGFFGAGMKAKSDDPLMIGQIQIVGVKNFNDAEKKITQHKKELIELANSKDPKLVSLGGGAKDIELREVSGIRGRMLIVHIIVNVLDAMGANAVNSMAEHISGKLEELSGGKARLKIISNLADKRVVRAEMEVSADELAKDTGLDGKEVIEGLLDAYAFAEADPYRATTHNKGIMNGIDAVVIATGNDFRAVEAGAHAYAARSGKYKPLTHYEATQKGIKGTIELPLAVGSIGGITAVHPKAKFSLKLMGVKNAKDLAETIACVGLAQNFAAMLALSTEGIQRGHMSLHARNIAMQSGAPDALVEKIAKKMVEERNINQKRAEELIRELS